MSGEDWQRYLDLRRALVDELNKTRPKTGKRLDLNRRIALLDRDVSRLVVRPEHRVGNPW